MKVKDVIDAVTNKSFYSLYDVDEYFIDNYGECLHPIYDSNKSIEYLQEVEVNDEAYFVSATILYKCDDGVVGVHGVYYVMCESAEARDLGELCTAREYVLENKPIYVPK